ncbi:DUF1810 domain-containing protein [Mucilaginibacter sp.]
MGDDKNLDRFLKAQETDYAIALSEMKNGRKGSHWMWYIFPQIQGLGFSETSKYYALNNIAEAQSFLNYPVLGNRLVAICQALLDLQESNANEIFGSPDDVKLKSSMTLFAVLSKTDPVFQSVLDKFFNGEKDKATLQLIFKEG